MTSLRMVTVATCAKWETYVHIIQNLPIIDTRRTTHTVCATVLHKRPTGRSFCRSTKYRSDVKYISYKHRPLRKQTESPSVRPIFVVHWKSYLPRQFRVITRVLSTRSPPAPCRNHPTNLPCVLLHKLSPRIRKLQHTLTFPAVGALSAHLNFSSSQQQ